MPVQSSDREEAVASDRTGYLLAGPWQQRDTVTYVNCDAHDKMQRDAYKLISPTNSE
jgi:hypothetical protein